MGPAHQSGAPKCPEHSHNYLVDNLVLKFKGLDSKRKEVVVAYCIGYDKQTVGRDSRQIFDHAKLKCKVSANLDYHKF